MLDRNVQRFIEQLRKYERMTQKSLADLLWRYSSQFVAGLVFRTIPRGQAEQAKRLGEATVKTDINRAYPSATRLYRYILFNTGSYVSGNKANQEYMAKLFWYGVKNSDSEALDEALDGVGGWLGKVEYGDWDGGEFHRSVRDPSTGKVRLRGGKGGYLVTGGDGHKDVRAYLQRKIAMVGWTKSGWINGFNPPGGVRGVPGWVMDQPLAPGHVRDNTKALNPEIIFSNQVSYLANTFRQQDVTRAFGVVAGRLKRDIERAAKQNAQRV